MEKILVLDFGGQYAELVAKRIREVHIFSEVLPYNTPLEDLRKEDYKGIILTGGKSFEDQSIGIIKELTALEIPILAIGHSAEMIAYSFDGRVDEGSSEFGKVDLTVDMTSRLFRDISVKSSCWMNHTHYISRVPMGFRISAKTDMCPVAAMECAPKKIYAIEFHPEILHTREGGRIIRNFVSGICECESTWNLTNFLEKSVEELKEKIGDKKVVCALSGGVNSLVAAVLCSKAIGDNLTCLFIDHGFLRKGEAKHVESLFREEFNINLITVNAKERFLGKLVGIKSQKQKKKIIDTEFLRVFEDEAHNLDEFDFLLAGTTYADKLKSLDEVKLPENIKCQEILTPFSLLFSEEVRKIGISLGMPEKLINHQASPYTGLSLRVMGKITDEKISVLKNADAIFVEEIEAAGFNRLIAHYFAVLSDTVFDGKDGDEYLLILRAVNNSDFMSSEWTRIPYEMIDRVSKRILTEVKGVRRVVYDVTSNPTATVEWE